MNDNDTKNCIKKGYYWTSEFNKPSKIVRNLYISEGHVWEFASLRRMKYAHATKAAAKLAIDARKSDPEPPVWEERKKGEKALPTDSWTYNDSVGQQDPMTDIPQVVTKRNTDDAVTHPRHYTSHPSGIECIQVTEHMNFCRGNAMKYIWRAGEKGDEIEDLKKARWYIDHEIARLAKAKEQK